MVLSEDHEDLHGLDRPSSESINTQINEDLYGFERPSSESMNTEINKNLYGFECPSFESINTQINENLYGFERPSSESMNAEINDGVNTSLRLKYQSVSSDSYENGRSKRPRKSSESNSQDTDLIGLTLNKTPSFQNLIESELSQTKRGVGRPSNSSRKKSTTEDFVVASKKLKAANVCATKLTIGTWKRVTKHEGDLIAKCYYAKRKLVWELLDGPLKSKIEIQWSTIIGIKAIMPQDDLPGVLEIQLNQPPRFYCETNPQPRKHTLWHQISDFTGGQAHIHRRHCVTFPPGVLDKPYEKLLRCDARLKELSKQPSPSQFYPYFDQPAEYNNEVSDFSFGNDYGSQLYLKMQYPHHHPAAASSPSTNLFPSLQMHNNSAMNVASLQQFSPSFPVSVESRSNYANIHQISGLWGGQGPNDFVNVPIVNQTIEPLPVSSTPPQANWAVPNEDNQAMYLQNDSIGNDQNALVLNYITNHLLNENQVTPYDEPTYTFPGHINNISLGATGGLPDLSSSYPRLNNYISLGATGGLPDFSSSYPTLNNYICLGATGGLPDLSSSYPTLNNYAVNVTNFETTYAQPISWMLPQETNDEFSTNYPTQDVNQEMKSAQERRN